jgi:HD-GYP domain-containing protein (c-di-GMP phosphodiesterase class II)
LKIKNIAKIPIKINNTNTYILNKNELYNLSIKKGTLTPEEREVINNHAVVSYEMLNKLSFPKKLSRVPLIAASHHKTIYKDENGKHGGYGAKEIMSEPMSIEDRILAVADVFEAVTASDRPYKTSNTLNQSLHILKFMVIDQELDRDIVKFFIENKIYEKYIKDNLNIEQIDKVTVTID